MKMGKVCSVPAVIGLYFPTGTTVLGAWCLWSKRNAGARMQPKRKGS